MMAENTLNHAIELCKHMIGLDRRKPYHRHGKVFYKGYRNYFSAPICGNKILDKLPHYIIEREITAKRVCYALTLDGLKWLRNSPSGEALMCFHASDLSL